MGGSVLFTLILRGVLSPFAHPLFTSMTGIGAGIAANSRNAAARPFYVPGRLRARGDPARAVEQLGVAVRRRHVPDRLPRRDGAAVRRDGDDRDLAAPPRAGRDRRAAPRLRAGGLDRAERDPAALQPRRAPGLARGRAAALRAGGRAGRRPVPGGRHRPRVPARPHREGGDRADGPAVARRGRRRGHPGATAGRRAPGGAHGGAAPPRRRGGLEPTTAGAARARGSRSRPTCRRRAGRTDERAAVDGRGITTRPARAAARAARGSDDRPARLAIGVVSAGRVGAVVGAAWAAAGHHVVATSGVSRESVRRAAALLPGRAAAAARRGRGAGRPRAARRARRRAPRPRPRPRGGRELPRGPDRGAHLGRARGRRARARRPSTTCCRSPCTP